MFNRRKFIQSSGAIAGATVMPAGIARSLAGDARPAPFFRVVVDERSAASRAFGARARRLGAPVTATAGDITDFWYRELDRRWRREPVVIAGLTAPGPLFCLERLAWDVGLRVVFRARHGRRDGGVDHDVAGTRGIRRHAAAIRDAGTAWPEAFAEVSARSFGKSTPARWMAVRTIDAGTDPDDANHLCSWVIGPVERRPREI